MAWRMSNCTSNQTYGSAHLLRWSSLSAVVAMALLWTRLQKMGLVVLLLTMAGSLFFGAAYHFFVPGSDNALELPPGHWESLFKTSATWLAVIETGAVAWCVWALKSTARHKRASSREFA